MSDQYIAYHFKVIPVQPTTEILIAELAERAFDSFIETEEGFTAYILQKNWSESILDDLTILKNDAFEINYKIEIIEPENWNETWEKNFEPIEVDDKVSIRATFHEPGELQYNIIIDPKMSFGTGHHETTHLMIQQLLQWDIKNKTVLDMGTGTGVLAILAEFLGAKHVDAVDIDLWSYENASENVERNNCTRINVFQGDASWFNDQKYEVILANINRNILLEDMATYVNHLTTNGLLILSGYYTEDLPLIVDSATNLKLQKKVTLERHNWVCSAFIKP